MENKTYVSLLEAGVPGEMLTLVENAFRIIFEDAAKAPAQDTFFPEMASVLGIDISSAQLEDGTYNKKKLKGLVGQDPRYQDAMKTAMEVVFGAEKNAGLRNDSGYVHSDLQTSMPYQGFAMKLKQQLALAFARGGIPGKTVADIIAYRAGEILQNKFSDSRVNLSTPFSRRKAAREMELGHIDTDSFMRIPPDQTLFAHETSAAGGIDIYRYTDVTETDLVNIVSRSADLEELERIPDDMYGNGTVLYKFTNSGDYDREVGLVVKDGMLVGLVANFNNFHDIHISSSVARVLMEDEITGLSPSFVCGIRARSALNNVIDNVELAVQLARKDVKLYLAALGLANRDRDEEYCAICIVPALVIGYDSGNLTAEDVEECFNDHDDLPPYVDMLLRRLYDNYSPDEMFLPDVYPYTGKALAMTLAGEKEGIPVGRREAVKMASSDWQMDELKSEGVHGLMNSLENETMGVKSFIPVCDEVMDRVCNTPAYKVSDIMRILDYLKNSVNDASNYPVDMATIQSISNTLSKFIHPGVQRRLIKGDREAEDMLTWFGAQMPGFKVDRRVFGDYHEDVRGFHETYGMDIPVKNIRKSICAGHLFNLNAQPGFISIHAYSILSKEEVCQKFDANHREKELVLEAFHSLPVGPMSLYEDWNHGPANGWDDAKEYLARYLKTWVIPYIEKYGSVLRDPNDKQSESGRRWMLYNAESPFGITQAVRLFDDYPDITRRAFLADGGLYHGIVLNDEDMDKVATEIAYSLNHSSVKGSMEFLKAIAENGDYRNMVNEWMARTIHRENFYRSMLAVFRLDRAMKEHANVRILNNEAYAMLASEEPGTALSFFTGMDAEQRRIMSEVISAPEVIQRILYKGGDTTQVDADGVKLLLSLASSSSWNAFTHEFVRANESLLRRVIETLPEESRAGAIRKLGLNNTMQAASGAVGDVRFTVVNGIRWMNSTVSGGTRSPVTPSITLFKMADVQQAISTGYPGWRLPSSTEVKLLHNTPFVSTVGFPVTGVLSDLGQTLAYDKFYGWCTKDNGSIVPYVVEGNSVRLGNRFNLPADPSQLMCAIKLVQAE